MKNTKVLEPSTNTHQIEGSIREFEELGNGTIKLRVEGKGIVTHGEHGTLSTEKENVIKYVQQEYNPVTKSMQAAFD